MKELLYAAITRLVKSGKFYFGWDGDVNSFEITSYNFDELKPLVTCICKYIDKNKTHEIHVELEISEIYMQRESKDNVIVKEARAISIRRNICKLLSFDNLIHSHTNNGGPMYIKVRPELYAEIKNDNCLSDLITEDDSLEIDTAEIGAPEHVNRACNFTHADIERMERKIVDFKIITRLHSIAE